jgi:hypothetical protein
VRISTDGRRHADALQFDACFVDGKADPFMVLGTRRRCRRINELAGDSQFRNVGFGLNDDEPWPALDLTTHGDVPIRRVRASFVREPPFTKSRPNRAIW